MMKGALMSMCKHESAVADALAKGELPEDLRIHVAGCAQCGEVDWVARRMLRFANTLSGEPAPSAASMWWRLNLRMRQEKARRAERPLIWMGRVFYLAIALTVALLVTLIPGRSQHVAAIGLLALSAVVLPVAIALWGWSRSKI
jgi:hypothetical protein